MNRLPDPRERPWLSVAEVAEITGEGEKVIRAALDAGQLPLIQLGRYKRIPTHQLLMQLDMTPDMSADPAPTGSNTTTDQDLGGPRRVNNATPIRSVQAAPPLGAS